MGLLLFRGRPKWPALPLRRMRPRDFDLVERAEDGATVDGQVTLERELRLLDVALALAVVEQQLHEARRDSGRSLRGRRKDVSELEARGRRARRQRDLRE